LSTILTVTQINTYIKSMIDGDFNLSNIYVTGEISNFTNHYRTGHFYFTLKDEKSSIKAVMFRQYSESIRFEPYDGLKVILRAKVSVFERDGVYQLYVTDMQPDGIGQLNLAFEQLKSKLFDEGLFDEKYKKPLPSIVNKVAVITSPTGAALQDIINVSKRRFPCFELMVVPVQVQGENSAEQIVNAINEVNNLSDVDVIILARGGGSIEDLWSFNEEKVARAIFGSDIPIITGIGHETDFTISDFVSDKRAPTPSAAAEIVTPDMNLLYEYVFSFENKIKNRMTDILTSTEIRLTTFSDIIELHSPQKRIISEVERLEKLNNDLVCSISSVLDKKQVYLLHQIELLDSLSPLKILTRGFAMAFDDNRNVLMNIDSVSPNQKVHIRLFDGVLNCKVIDKERII